MKFIMRFIINIKQKIGETIPDLIIIIKAINDKKKN